MPTEQLEDLEIVEETLPTTPIEQEPKKKKAGPHNPDQAAKFIEETNKSLDHFLKKMYNYEPYAISEHHHALCEIEEYFPKADKDVVLGLIDNKSCKMLRVETTKESEDREKFPDPRTSTDNIITGTQALSRLVAMPNFTAIQSDQWETKLPKKKPHQDTKNPKQNQLQPQT